MKRLALLCGLAAALLATAPWARALVVIEGGKSRLFVATTGELAWDSNVYSNATEEGDFYETGRLALDYERNAGVLAANTGFEWAYSHFERLRDESSWQPSAHASLARKRGRLTGKLDLGWRQANEADNFANRRTRFGEGHARFQLQYPLNHRFSFKTEATYENRDFRDPTLFDRRIVSATLDVLHAYTSQLDLVAAYRVRASDLRTGSDRLDHALLLGASGRILPRLDGSVRLGFQRRLVRAPGTRPLDGIAVSISTLWTPRNWLNLGIQVSKDFATTSTALSTDGFTVALESRLATVGQLTLTAGAGYSHYAFFEEIMHSRNDTNRFFRLGADYPLTQRLKCTASATWMRSCSSFAFADFDRRLLNLGVSARF